MNETGKTRLLRLLHDLYSNPNLSDEEFAIADSILGEHEQYLMATGALTLDQIIEIETSWRAA